jgi:hypothetical protein
MMNSTRKNTSEHKITELFDNNWRSTRSAVRTRESDVRPYDPAHSWEARHENPKTFSKLEANYVTVQPTRPIVLSGSAVVPLDSKKGMDVLNIKQPPRELCPIPLTQEQRDVFMEPNLKAKVPMLAEAASTNKVIVMSEPLGYKNMDVRPASFKQIDVPQALIDAGPQCDKKLLTPAERREILEYERRQRVAKEIIRQAVATREKTKKLVTGQGFHRGIVGVDSSHNENSEIYGQRAQREHAHDEYKSITHLERKANIAAHTSSVETNGNFFIPDTIASRVNIEKGFQSKGGQNMVGLSFDETFNRLFNRRMDRPPKTIRTLHMRDQELSGKQYNLVNHTLIEHWPARQFFERDVDKRMHHASQFAALEGPRNLQGTLLTDKKF